MIHSQRPAWLRRPPTKVDIVFFDLETTGGNPKNSSIIEIGAIKFSEGKEVGRFETLVKPLHSISPIVQKITGIKGHMLKNAPKIEDIFEDFSLFIGDAILVSHGATADVAFIEHYSEKILNKPFKNFHLCTHLLVSQFLPELPSKTLTGVSEHFKFNVKYAHTAIDDAEITEYVFWKLCEVADSEGFSTCEDLIKVQGDHESLKKLGIGFDANAFNYAPAVPGILFIQGSEHEITYLSASANLRKSLSQFLDFTKDNKDFQKILVDASGFKTTRTASFLDALMREKNELNRLHLPLDPRLVQKRSEKFVQIFIPQDLLKYAERNGDKFQLSSSVFPVNNSFLEKDDVSFSDEHTELTHPKLQKAVKHTRKTLRFIKTLKYTLNRKHSDTIHFGYLKQGAAFAFGPFQNSETALGLIDEFIHKYPFENKLLPLHTRFKHLTSFIEDVNELQNGNFKLKSGLCVISNNAFKEFEIFVVVKSQIVKKVRLRFEESDKLKSSRYFTRLFENYYSEIINENKPLNFTNDVCDNIELFTYWITEKHGEGEWIDFQDLESLYDPELAIV